MDLTETKPSSPWAVASDGLECAGNLTDVLPCAGNPNCADVCQPTDCQLGEWNDWSSPTCEGLCMRTRGIAALNNDCGKPCVGTMNATKSCPADCSSKDCELSEWSGWTTCASDFDQTFNGRKILQFPTFNGMVCSGVLNKTGSCKTGAGAPIDCQLTEWTDWSECGVTCGTGQHTRERSLISEAQMGGSPCDGSLRLLKSCDMGKCPAEEEEVAQNCEYGAWSLWSKCAGETDQQVYRTRYISKFASGKGEKCDAQLMETRGCDTDPHRDVDCLFSVWSGWSACPVSCGGGQNTRSRSIQEHARGHGKVCEGALLEASACGDVQCPGEQIQARESCETSDWSGWAACSASCGEGSKVRKREITEPALAGTDHCTEALAETAQCQNTPCGNAKDCAWGTWTSWSDCVPSPDVCGVGYKRRTREIAQMPVDGGALCVPGVKDQVMPVAQCRGQPECCVNGKWDEWEDWGGCSAHCGKGTRKRMRQLAVQETWCGDPAPGPAEAYEGCEAPGCGSDHDCEFNDWSGWTLCSSNCHGNTTRTRSIKVHAMGAGLACNGETEVVERCNPATGQPQPWSCEMHPSAPKGKQDCLMAEWAEWSPCSQTCQGGYQTRERHIQIHPEKGGLSCETSLKEVNSCHADVACFAGRADCEWEEWQTWSECNNLRFQYRSRGQKQPAAGGGLPCTGDVRELQPCGSDAAAAASEASGTCVAEEYSCGWFSWSDWSPCTATCGTGGTRMRSRKMQVGNTPSTGMATQQKFAFDKLESRLRDLEGHRMQDTLSSFGLGFASLTLVLLLVRGLRTRVAARAADGEYDIVPQHA